MEKIGIIGGTLLMNSELFVNAEKITVETVFGNVEILQNKNIYFFQRHGKKLNVPPHRINHKANLLAFKQLGIEKIISINSTGSLKKNIKAGSIIIPNDYIDFANQHTFYDEGLIFTTPRIDENLRKKIIQAAKKIKMQIINKGVYVQTRGPRLETKAEINFLKNYADVVGMTLANEATLSAELGISYASICSVDNYANGIAEKELKSEEIAKNQKENFKKIKKLLMKTLQELK